MFALYMGILNMGQGGVTYILRIPFIFVIGAFYGYIVQAFVRDKQKQLAISEDKYQGLFENATEGIVILRNPQLRIADLNGEAGRLLGCQKSEDMEKDFLDLFDPLMRERARDFLEKAIKDGEGAIDTFSLIRKDGVIFEVDLSIKRIDLGDESFFQVIIQDLTEQRKLEKKILESKRNLEAIFDGIQDQVSVQTPDYTILRVNRAVINKTGLTFQDLIGKKCYQAYYQKAVPCEKCPVTKTLETKRFASSTMKIPDNDITLRIFSYPIFDERGKYLLRD